MPGLLLGAGRCNRCPGPACSGCAVGCPWGSRPGLCGFTLWISVSCSFSFSCSVSVSSADVVVSVDSDDLTIDSGCGEARVEGTPRTDRAAAKGGAGLRTLGIWRVMGGCGGCGGCFNGREGTSGPSGLNG